MADRSKVGCGTWIVAILLLLFLALGIAFLVIGWSAAGHPSANISGAGWVGVIIGAIITCGIGIGLMASLFLGRRER